jgi:sulfatase modifying factor 1
VGDLSKRRRFSSTNVYFPFDDGHALIAPVRSYKPNAWGLYDMIGNLEEWCEDVYMKAHDVVDQTAVKGPVDAGRVLKGGAWVGNEGTSRSATRISMRASARRDFQGFRVALDVE